MNKKVAQTSETSFVELLAKQDICNFTLKQSSSIFSKEKTDYIFMIIECMKMNPEKKILITGHTCNVGTAKNNIILGRRRAMFVKNHMVNLGADPKRLLVESKGESMPIVPNTTEENRRKNRRVVIEIK